MHPFVREKNVFVGRNVLIRRNKQPKKKFRWLGIIEPVTLAPVFFLQLHLLSHGHITY